MTHEYTLLVGGTVMHGRDGADAEAVAWAHGVVLAIGTSSEVRTVSRGDSTVVDLAGAFVIPLADGAGVGWPTSAVLEVGAAADLAVIAADPRPGDESALRSLRHPIAVVRAGRVVSGALPRPDRPDDSSSAQARS